MLKTLLLDPKVFQYFIMFLYLLQTFRWVYERNYPMALYWIAAFQITLAVTWSVKS